MVVGEVVDVEILWLTLEANNCLGAYENLGSKSANAVIDCNSSRYLYSHEIIKGGISRQLVTYILLV